MAAPPPPEPTPEPPPEPLRMRWNHGEVPVLVNVRQWTAAALGDLGEDHLHMVLLLSTELLTNAYEHGTGPYGIHLHHTRTPCRVTVEVHDSSPDMPVIGRSRLGDNRGRGLIMVDKLAHDWGTRPTTDGGKTVWAVISCDIPDWTPCTSNSDVTPPATPPP